MRRLTNTATTPNLKRVKSSPNSPTRRLTESRWPIARDNHRSLTGSRVPSPALTGSVMPPFALVDQAAKHLSTLDMSTAELCHGVSQSGRAKVTGAVWASTVAVPDIIRRPANLEDLPAPTGYSSQVKLITRWKRNGSTPDIADPRSTVHNHHSASWLPPTAFNSVKQQNRSGIETKRPWPIINSATRGGEDAYQGARGLISSQC
jgi:hypothetical protein